MPLTVRPATPADVPIIVEFNRRLARETEDKALDPAIVDRRRRSRPRRPRRKGPYFLACDGARSSASCRSLRVERLAQRLVLVDPERLRAGRLPRPGRVPRPVRPCPPGRPGGRERGRHPAVRRARQSDRSGDLSPAGHERNAVLYDAGIVPIVELRACSHAVRERNVRLQRFSESCRSTGGPTAGTSG